MIEIYHVVEFGSIPFRNHHRFAMVPDLSAV